MHRTNLQELVYSFSSKVNLLYLSNGKVGFLKGDGLLTLVLVDEATEVKYEGEVQVGGMIAWRSHGCTPERG